MESGLQVCHAQVVLCKERHNNAHKQSLNRLLKELQVARM
jgi:hypothetical protein